MPPPASLRRGAWRTAAIPSASPGSSVARSRRSLHCWSRAWRRRWCTRRTARPPQACRPWARCCRCWITTADRSCTPAPGFPITRSPALRRLTAPRCAAGRCTGFPCMPSLRQGRRAEHAWRRSMSSAAKPIPCGRRTAARRPSNGTGSASKPSCRPTALQWSGWRPAKTPSARRFRVTRRRRPGIRTCSAMPRAPPCSISTPRHRAPPGHPLLPSCRITKACSAVRASHCAPACSRRWCSAPDAGCGASSAATSGCASLCSETAATRPRSPPCGCGDHAFPMPSATWRNCTGSRSSPAPTSTAPAVRRRISSIASSATSRAC